MTITKELAQRVTATTNRLATNFEPGHVSDKQVDALSDAIDLLNDTITALAAKDKQIAVLKKAHAHDEAAISVFTDRIAELEGLAHQYCDWWSKAEKKASSLKVKTAELEEIATDYCMKFQRAHDALKHAALMHKGEARQEQQPVAYMYRDTLRDGPWVSIPSVMSNFSDEDISEFKVTEIPLYEHPAPAAQPVTVKLPERYELQETSRNPYQSYMKLEPDADGDWLKRDDVLAMLTAAGITIAEGE